MSQSNTSARFNVSLLSVVLMLSAVAGCGWWDKEQVTFYPTYGYRDGDTWIIPVRIWAHETRRLADRVATRAASSLSITDENERKNLNTRITDLLADSESGETVTFQFDGDPDKKDYPEEAEPGQRHKTDGNGLIEIDLRIPMAGAQRLLAAQGSKDWLTFSATSPGHSGTGRVRLIENDSTTSVISDIDDTIKVTEIPAGAKVVVRNTFFRNFVAADGMAAMYRDLAEAPFHYVSGGPWQLHAPLEKFRKDAGFPEGSFHMKNVRKNLLEEDTWEDLRELAVGDATVNQKIEQITEIMEHFPARSFILIGDSGEADPEVYRKIKEDFGARVQEIRIRDVVNDKKNHPCRLEGMTVIPAPVVKKGVSQFDSIK